MKLTLNTFLTSDTHFLHQALVKLQHRPEDFNERIIEAWNLHINKHDKVLHLGDLGLGSKSGIKDICKRLHGEKYLIRGNHDHESDTYYKECGFTPIEPIYKPIITDRGRTVNLLFTHEPVIQLPEGNWFNIHGHLHGDGHREEFKGLITDRHFDVGVDATKFIPVPFTYLLGTIYKMI